MANRTRHIRPQRNDTCIACGEIVPEGRQVCWRCDHDAERVFCSYEHMALAVAEAETESESTGFFDRMWQKIRGWLRSARRFFLGR